MRVRLHSDVAGAGVGVGSGFAVGVGDIVGRGVGNGVGEGEGLGEGEGEGEGEGLGGIVGLGVSVEMAVGAGSVGTTHEWSTEGITKRSINVTIEVFQNKGFRVIPPSLGCGR
jgi:hypothetical protein